MPAVRTQSSNHNAEASSSKPKPDTNRKHNKRRPALEKSESAAPGVQKIKAALRQARRLLARDKLAANVRVETERRLEALEAELKEAELSRREKTFAMRYHKVKFFERQKVIRKIKQVRKRLESTETKTEKKKIKAELDELRVDLNYILHYPPLKKYISLFPGEARNSETTPTQPDTDKTNAERQEVRKWVREQMEEGTLPSEPELEASSNNRGKRSKDRTANPGATEFSKTTAHSIPQQEPDEFFGEDEDEDEGVSS